MLLAAVSGALRRYLLDRDEAPRRLRAIVPFNLRPPDQPIPRGLGNRFGLVFLELPVDVSDRRGRLRDVRAAWPRSRTRPTARSPTRCSSAMGVSPTPIERLGIDLFSAKGTAVMTNVPGPREPIYLAGTRVRSVMVWAPASGSVGMSVSILSYQGEVTIGLMVDSHLVPDPHEIVHQIEREVAGLARLKPSAA